MGRSGDRSRFFSSLTFCAICSTIQPMRKTGIREARQNLSALIEEVKKGREILITDRGKPVARLGPPPLRGKAFTTRASFRKQMPVLDPPLSQSVLEEREDRL